MSTSLIVCCVTITAECELLGYYGSVSGQVSRQTMNFYNHNVWNQGDFDRRDEIMQDIDGLALRFLESECTCEDKEFAKHHGRKHGPLLWPVTGVSQLTYPKDKSIIASHIGHILAHQHRNKTWNTRNKNPVLEIPESPAESDFPTAYSGNQDEEHSALEEHHTENRPCLVAKQVQHANENKSLPAIALWKEKQENLSKEMERALRDEDRSTFVLLRKEQEELSREQERALSFGERQMRQNIGHPKHNPRGKGKMTSMERDESDMNTRAPFTACLPCNTKHYKCDLQRPCTSCVNKGTKCVEQNKRISSSRVSDANTALSYASSRDSSYSAATGSKRRKTGLTSSLQMSVPVDARVSSPETLPEGATPEASDLPISPRSKRHSGNRVFAGCVKGLGRSDSDAELGPSRRSRRTVADGSIEPASSYSPASWDVPRESLQSPSYHTGQVGHTPDASLPTRPPIHTPVPDRPADRTVPITNPLFVPEDAEIIILFHVLQSGDSYLSEQSNAMIFSCSHEEIFELYASKSQIPNEDVQQLKFSFQDMQENACVLSRGDERAWNHLKKKIIWLYKKVMKSDDEMDFLEVVVSDFSPSR